MSRKITLNNVFDKPRYRTILKLIIDYSNPELETKIKFAHLKYVLVKNPKYSNQFRTDKKMKEFFKLILLKDENIPEDIENFFKSQHRNSQIQRLIHMGYFSEEDKFNSDQTLHDALRILKKLKLIESKPDIKGYNYLIPTELCLVKYWRWFLHYSIDNFIPDNWTYLFELWNIVMIKSTYIKKK